MEVTAKIVPLYIGDDYQALGDEYVAAIGEEGKYFTSVDTGGTDWLWLAMAEYGDDWTGGSMIRQTFSLIPFRKC